MIDEIIHCRLDAINTYHFSEEWENAAIPFEESLTEAQLTTFHKLLDCVSETATAEIRSAYKVGFKDGATMMQEIQD